MTADFFQRYYSALAGRRIVRAGVKKEDGEEWPFFILDNGWRIEVSRDGEGNGPGFLFGLPDPRDPIVSPLPPCARCGKPVKLVGKKKHLFHADAGDAVLCFEQGEAKRKKKAADLDEVRA